MSSRTKRYLRRSRSKQVVNRESRVGKAFQAEVPSILVKQEVIESKLFDMERMLWNPNILPRETVQNYLKCVKAYGWKGLNEESALYLLHTSDYDTGEALKKFHLLPASAAHLSAWSAEECHHFDYGLAKHGKDFYRLQKTMLTRSTQEIVQYYYSWKKTERYDTFVQKVTQFENVRFRNKILKKMYRSTDFTDFFLLDESFEH